MSLGLLVAIPETIPIIFGAEPRNNVGFLWLNPLNVYFHIFGNPINGGQISNTVITVGVVLAILAAFRWTGVGLQMRAVVESRRLAQLEGVNSARVAAGAWAMSSVLAGLSGVLLLPQLHPVDPTDPLSFTTLLIAGITAAALASLSSISIAFIAGAGIGILQNVLTLILPTSSSIASSLRQDALPFILLGGVLLFNRSLRTVDQSTDPLSAVDPPPPPPAAQIRDRRLDIPTKWGWRILVVAFLASCLTWVPDNWVFPFGVGVVLLDHLLVHHVDHGDERPALFVPVERSLGSAVSRRGQLANHFNLPILLGSGGRCAPRGRLRRSNRVDRRPDLGPRAVPVHARVRVVLRSVAFHVLVDGQRSVRHPRTPSEDRHDQFPPG